MSNIVIKIENLSKQYRLGAINHGTLHRDLQSWWARLRGKEDPNSLIYSQQPLNTSITDDRFWALKDISFDVKEGEVLGIIGLNGAGKSTILKIISRITTPTRGTVKIKGRVASLLEVGTGFHPELTGRENIFLNGAILGMTKSEIRSKFDEIVDFAGIEKFIDTPVKRYSSGMCVRLAFAVAAHLEPEILVVDEVLAVGDSQFQKKCLGKMKDVSKEGRTVIFVSHNMGAVRKLCSIAFCLEDGMMTTNGPTEKVISDYLTTYAVKTSSVVELPPGRGELPGVATRLSFFTQKGTPQAQFRLNEPWKILLEFEIFRTTSHVIAAVGITTFEGVPLITYWSKPKNLIPGKYQIIFECTLPLTSNELQFAVGLSSHETAFYYVQSVGHVSICDVAVEEQPFRAKATGLFLGTQEGEINSLESVE
jgi:lipopolysaccharide transport system ATP-binding protein